MYICIVPPINLGLTLINLARSMTATLLLSMYKHVGKGLAILLGIVANPCRGYRAGFCLGLIFRYIYMVVLSATSISTHVYHILC